MNKLFTHAFIIVTLFSFTSCAQTSIDGVYELDKAELKENMEVEMKEKNEDNLLDDMAKSMIEKMILSINMQIHIKEDMIVTKLNMGGENSIYHKTTWTQSPDGQYTFTNQEDEVINFTYTDGHILLDGMKKGSKMKLIPNQDKSINLFDEIANQSK